MPEDTTSRRKDAHLDLAATGDVEPAGNSTLLECVHLVHCAMPEMGEDDLDASTPFMGKVLRYPLIITGMTGGTDRAGEVNRELAALAERFGIAFGVGSQRAMIEDPKSAVSFEVRQVAPSTVVIGNIGLRQAAAIGASGAERLVRAIGADGLALHLNPGQELTQPEGDRDFRGGYTVVADLVKAFGDRLLVKETGCGISPDVAKQLADLGVKNIDVSGLGGTSWVRVEQLRASGVQAAVGAVFSGWGIPTAAAVATVRRAVGREVRLIASGGIRNGLEAAKAIALGADLAGMALPLFRALQQGGPKAAQAALEAIIGGLRQALILTGSRTPARLREKRKVITGELKDWMAAL
ncbi:MAG: type 2 isopentenyl-diphosphate Delta-isomerase [Myxococcaceae bacterium]|nr:type 2 isopentenyl-diphosphate Delta-isomerase [Myxococcaceae bacterium]